MKHLVLLLSALFCAADAPALKISDFYGETRVGQWILMRASDGLETRTAVTGKGDGKITLRIISMKGGRTVSDSEQLVDVERGKVLSIRIFEEGRIREIRPRKTELDDLFHIEFKPDGKEKVRVEKGVFDCTRYKGLYKDNRVRVWIHQDVPVLHLVKITMKNAAVRLVDYGAAN